MLSDLHDNSPAKVLLFEASGEIKFPGDALEQYHIHIYCHSGEMDFSFKGEILQAGAGEFVFWYAHSAVSNISFTKNFTATVLLVEEEFLNSNLPDVSWSIDVLIHTRDHPILHFNEQKNKRKVLDNFQLLFNKFQEKDHTFYEEINNAQMFLFTLEMWHVFKDEFDRNNRNLQSGNLYDRFVHLLRLHCMREREVRFYAAKLFISPKHLNFVCKQNTGIPASEWIQLFVKERLVLLLENQQMSIAQIADEMNFSSRSFFTRYVKKLLGMTPTTYRSRLK